MIFMGLDLSITGTGIAVIDEEGAAGRPWLDYSGVVKTPGPKQACMEERIELIRRAVRKQVMKFEPDLIMIENYSYGRPNQMAVLGEVNGVIRNWLWKNEWPWDVVPPLSLKKFATGNGRATKEEMVVAAQPWAPNTKLDDNQADAIHLASWGMHHYQQVVS